MKPRRSDAQSACVRAFKRVSSILAPVTLALVFGTIGQPLEAQVAAAARYDVLHNFPDQDAQVAAGLVQVPDGTFYGVTNIPGGFFVPNGDFGSFFKVTPSGEMTTLHIFGAEAGAAPLSLTLGSDGNFYGMRYPGVRPNDYGAIFRIDSLGNLTTLYTFSGGGDGGYPSGSPLIEAPDGSFYGLTSGNLFALPPFSYPGVPPGTFFKLERDGRLKTLYTFDCNSANGCLPGSLIRGRNGDFYALTQNLIRITPEGKVRVVYAFDPGSYPDGLVQGTDGNLYGTTQFGGLGLGTVYRIDAQEQLTILHSFNYDDGYEPFDLIEGRDGKFYGATLGSNTPNNAGTLFRVDTSGNFTVLYNFSQPGATNLSDSPGPAITPLLQAEDGMLYGATRGGQITYSTIFRFDLQNPPRTLYTFESEEGANPFGSLSLDGNGSLYGATFGGGAGYRNGGQGDGAGTIFKLDTSGTLTTLHSFDSAYLLGAPVFGSDGRLFQSELGKPSGLAGPDVYALTTIGSYSVFHQFSDDEGSPSLPVVEAADGNLYGVTSRPDYELGPDGSVIQIQSFRAFKLDSGGNLTTLHIFDPTHGAPRIYAGAGNGGGLSGLTSTDSGWNFFQLGSDGSFADHGLIDNVTLGNVAALIVAGDGSVYGAGSGDGPNGLVFKVEGDGSFSIIHTFEGGYPGALVQSSDGVLFGATYGDGKNGTGTIFRIEPTGRVETIYEDFTFSRGVNVASLVQRGRCELDGSTVSGGKLGGGVIFRLRMVGEDSSCR